MGLVSLFTFAIVVDVVDAVVFLAVFHQMDAFIEVFDEREEALLRDEGLTEAFELYPAARLDFGDLQGLHVQDNPG